MSWLTWLDEADRRLGEVLAGRSALALEAAAASVGLTLFLQCLEVGASTSESFYRAHVRGRRARFLFRTEDRALCAHISMDGVELRAGLGDDGQPDEAAWDVVVVFRSASALAALLTTGRPDVVRALVGRDLRVSGNVAFLYQLGFMVADLGRRLGLTAGGRA